MLSVVVTASNCFLKAFSASAKHPRICRCLKVKEILAYSAKRRGFSLSSSRNSSDIHQEDAEEYELVGMDSLKLGDHSVFVVQPHISVSSQLPSVNITTPQLQLAESVALVDCLPGWKVSGKMILRTSTPDEQIIFKGQRLIKLCNAINQCPAASALFISLDRINGMQRQILMEQTKLEYIFDRYMLVLEIFRLRAQTKQAKLQVALAEIPYIKSNLKSEVSSFNRQGGGFHAVGGPGETPLELMMRHFRFREQKIKKRLERLRKRRTEQREVRKRSNLPVVAVVGYTNAGKTTLIKALSKSEKLKPKNHLFATLDVTTHAAVTDENMRYLLVDTVGFLSNLPHSLIDAFTATMEDMLQADLILHVCDVSHPDHENQRLNVYKVLSDLHLPKKLLETMIEVHNKVDLVVNQGPISKLNSGSKKSIKHKGSSINTQPSSLCAISATEGVGLTALNELLHSRLVKVTGGQSMSVRVPADGDHLDWLNRYATVDGFDNDGDYHFIIDFTISEAMWNKFKARYHAYRVL